MSLLRALVLVSAALCLLPACGSDSSEAAHDPAGQGPAAGQPDGKADRAGAQVMTGLFADYTFDGPEQASLTLSAEVVSAHYDTPKDGDTLTVAFRDAAHASFEITAEMKFYEDGLGGYATETVDISDLLPLRTLEVVISGELNDGTAVEETWRFEDLAEEGVWQEGATSDEAPAADAIKSAQATYTIDPEHDEAAVSFTMEINGDLQDVLSEGDHLTLAISDRAHDLFTVPGELEWVSDEAHLVSGWVDVSDLLPWQSLMVHVSGTLADGTVIDQRFTFDEMAEIGTPLTPEPEPAQPSAEIFSHVEMTQNIINGEEGTVQIVAELSDVHYDTPEAGDRLTVAISALDGNPDFTVPGELVYEPDGVGGFITDDVDVSDLLPTRAFRVQITGTLKDGTEVAVAYDFMEGAPAGIRVEQ